MEYGIYILADQEIGSYEAPTRIANAPAYVKGTVNLRAVIGPVLNLQIKLSLARLSCDSPPVTVILGVGGHVVGAVVDSASDGMYLERQLQYRERRTQGRTTSGGCSFLSTSSN